jgi:hypothetical protein
MSAARYRAIQMSHLNSSDMQCTLFVQNSDANKPQIDILVRAIEILGGWRASRQLTSEFTRDEIDTFFANPLCKVVMDITAGTTDYESTLLLVGPLTMPAGLLDKLPRKKTLQRDVVAQRWSESVLGEEFANPNWSAVCLHVVKLAV